MTDLDEPDLTELEPRPGSGDRVLPGEERGGIAQFSDGRLVISIATGSHDALAEAYSRHGTSVHRVAQRITGPNCRAQGGLVLLSEASYFGTSRAPGIRRHCRPSVRPA